MKLTYNEPLKLTQLFDSSIENGYLTGFSEDGVWDGPFQYRLKGFSLPPTDFYPRPYFLDVARRTKLWSDRCINNRNIAQIHLEYVRCVFDAFPKKLKFFVSFSGKVYKALFKLSIIGFLQLPSSTGKKIVFTKTIRLLALNFYEAIGIIRNF